MYLVHKNAMCRKADTGMPLSEEELKRQIRVDDHERLQWEKADLNMMELIRSEQQDDRGEKDSERTACKTKGKRKSKNKQLATNSVMLQPAADSIAARQSGGKSLTLSSPAQVRPSSYPLVCSLLALRAGPFCVHPPLPPLTHALHATGRMADQRRWLATQKSVDYCK